MIALPATDFDGRAESEKITSLEGDRRNRVCGTADNFSAAHYGLVGAPFTLVRRPAAALWRPKALTRRTTGSLAIGSSLVGLAQR